jgi:hypothetical protein
VLWLFCIETGGERVEDGQKMRMGGWDGMKRALEIL